MSKLKSAIVLGALAIPAVAIAHTPIEQEYATRGECEAQLAKDNIFHARDKVARQEDYETVGEAMRDMHEHFWCERIGDSWFMLRIPF